MNKLITLFTLSSVLLLNSLVAVVHAAEEGHKTGYIADDLFIYMLAGPGKSYRILGTVNAGDKVTITGNQTEEYSEIIDEKNRTTWVESKYVSTKAGLRYVVKSLNEKITNSNQFTTKLDGQVNELNNKVTLLSKEKKALADELSQLNDTLAKTKLKIKDQDTNIKKQWFFTGAMVLGIGLLLGLIIPRFFSRRRGSMDSWS